MASNGEVGYFGKLPQRGDFVTGGLGRGFLDVWDGWLQDAIACSRDQLGDAWLDTYLTSPIWRFLLCDGICGGSAWAGVLIPSVDKVGRYYPLTIAAPLPAGSNPMQFSVLADDWFRAAEALALEPLADDAPDLDVFADRVEALGLPGGDNDEQFTRLTPLMADTAMRVESVSDGQSLLSQQGALAGGLLAGMLLRYSLWWTEGSHRVGPNMLICKHLPAVEKYAALLNGDWQQFGWMGDRLSPLRAQAALGVPSAGEI